MSKIPCESCGEGVVYSTFSIKQCKDCQKRLVTIVTSVNSIYRATGINHNTKGWISGYRQRVKIARGDR